jgi:hypothetical protein
MADIKIKLGIDAAGLQQGAQTAKKAVNDLVQSAKSQKPIIGKPEMFAAAGAAMAGVAIAARGMYSAMEAGGALVDMSAQTGIAIDRLMVLQTAFSQAGLGADGVQPVISKMQRSIMEAASGSVEASKKFSDLGVNLYDLQGLSADEQLQKIGEAINAIEDPTQKAAAAMDVFGKSGAKMLSFFSAGGLSDATENLGKQARLMKENAGLFDRASDVLGTSGSKVQGLFIGMASEVLPQLITGIDALNKIDLTGIGESLGSGIAIAIEMIDRAMKKFEQVAALLKPQTDIAAQSGGQAFMGMGGMGGPSMGMNAMMEQANIAKTAPETQGIFAEYKAAVEEKKAAAKAKYKTEETPGGTGFTVGPSKAAGVDISSSLSSLQKVGGASGGMGGGIVTDQAAWQSVRIQEQILEYSKQLLEVVKNGGQDLGITPSGSGMVLTA